MEPEAQPLAGDELKDGTSESAVRPGRLAGRRCWCIGAMVGFSVLAMTVLCVVFIVMLLDYEKKDFHKHVLQAEEAVCLDGSRATFYLNRGSGSGASKWLIYHEGGGWCESMDDCLHRSTISGLGSSEGSPDTLTFRNQFFRDVSEPGIFTRDPDANPTAHNWNHVYLPYCDGASFSGNLDQPVEHKGTALYFRGNVIRKAVAQELLTAYSLGSATDVIVSGRSAGGLSVYLHVDQWCDTVLASNPRVKCVGLPDSGFFLEYQDPLLNCSLSSRRDTINGNYECGLHWVYETQNASAGMNQQCVAAHTATGTEWQCMFAQQSAQHIRAPVFALQSQYDGWARGNVQGGGGDSKTQQQGDELTALVQSTLMGHNNESGAFLDSCQHHCGQWNTIQIDGDLSSQALQSWYNGIGNPSRKKFWNQNKPYPCNDCCDCCGLATWAIVCIVIAAILVCLGLSALLRWLWLQTAEDPAAGPPDLKSDHAATHASDLSSGSELSPIGSAQATQP